MVKQILIILLVFSNQLLFSQCEDSIDYIGVSIADEMPATIQEIKDSIQKILICPDTIVEDRSVIIVIVSFWVDTVGNTYCHKIERGYASSFDKEALIAIKKLRFPKPAYNKGKPVSIMYSLPVKFHCCKNKKYPNP